MRRLRLLSLRRNLLAMVAIPIAAKGISMVADHLRDRHADSRAAARLDQAGHLLRKARRLI